MFSTDWKKWVKENSLVDIRLPKYLAWVHSLLKPIRIIDSGEFSELRAEITEQYRWNGTVHSLTKLLNDRYDPIERRIKLELVEKTPVLYYKGADEQQDAFYSPVGNIEEYFYLSIEDTNAATDEPYELKVKFWHTLNFVPEEVYELLEIYRLAGVRPQLFTYDGSLDEILIDSPFYFLPE